jgi:hypothetical protein
MIDAQIEDPAGKLVAREIGCAENSTRRSPKDTILARLATAARGF